MKNYFKYLKKELQMSELATEILKIASKAVKDAQKKSLEKGIANVYSKNKHIYFQLPDGTITQNTPKEYINIGN
jgi:hypothetical protein